MQKVEIAVAVALLGVAAIPPIALGASSGDELLTQIVSSYSRAELDRGGWENSFAPSAAAGTPIVAVAVGDGVTLHAAADARREATSGDELLTQVIGAYTREMLDRGGWENPWFLDGRCAAGNALLAVAVGEGVTTVGPAEPSTVSVTRASPRKAKR